MLRYILSSVFLLNMIINVRSLTKVEEAFEEWYTKYGKNYQNALEHRYRFAVFAQNYAEIEYCNSQNSKDLTLNQFADLTNEELYSNNILYFTSHHICN